MYSRLNVIPYALILRICRRFPSRILSFGGGLGDDLLCTSVFREMKKRNFDKLGMVTRYPELFSGNDDIDVVLPFRSALLGMARLGWVDVITPWYTSSDPTDVYHDRDLPPADHIIALMCSYSGIEGNVSLRPYWHFQPNEKSFGRFASVQIAIQSTCLSKDAKMPLKDWFPERFQEVVDRFRSSVTFVQIGRSADVPLSNVIDLRGKTSVRETAAILANSKCFVGLVGFLMHLARAVDCRSVIVYGGRETPLQSGYIANVNIYKKIACSPCWGWHRCDYGKACMDQISASDVQSGIEQVLQESLPALPVAERIISPIGSLITNDFHIDRFSWAVNRTYDKFPPGSR